MKFVEKLGVLGLVLVLTFIAHDSYAADNSKNNEMIKECLIVWGYDYAEKDPQKRINNFNWNKASGCVSNFVVEEHKKRIEKDRQFVESKPWFKGTNWKWQEKAEYTCTKEYHTGMTICRKPYYVN